MNFNQMLLCDFRLHIVSHPSLLWETAVPEKLQSSLWTLLAGKEIYRLCKHDLTEFLLVKIVNLKIQYVSKLNLEIVKISLSMPNAYFLL